MACAGCKRRRERIMAFFRGKPAKPKTPARVLLFVESIHPEQGVATVRLGGVDHPLTRRAIPLPPGPPPSSAQELFDYLARPCHWPPEAWAYLEYQQAECPGWARLAEKMANMAGHANTA